MECTHSLTQQVKKKKKKKKRTHEAVRSSVTRERKRKRLLPEFNCAEERRIPAARRWMRPEQRDRQRQTGSDRVGRRRVES